MGENGRAVHRANERIFLYAFDLIELNGDDLRRDPLEVRKATLASIVAKASPGIRFNEHMEGDGETVFRHAEPDVLPDFGPLTPVFLHAFPLKDDPASAPQDQHNLI
jgi:hypothetical protein